MSDIFDRLTQEQDEDIFGEIEKEDSAVENLKNTMTAVLEKFDSKDRKNENRKLSDEMKEFIREEIAKIKPKQNVIERTIEKKVIQPEVVHLEPRIVEAPPQIIKEVRVEVEKKDHRKYVEESKYLDLLVKVSKLEKQLQETRRMAESPIIVGGPGGPGVIGIPPPEPHEGKVLTVVNRKASWAASAGGASISGYTINNPTTLKTIDLSSFTLDELGQIVGTLIGELQV